ncbi:MAG: LON peptidase substrate-binding domain-containing protein [Gammaproteobacteria bacterium]|nr:LON peptidase substrate-binding domain-containing protein [Gammaproteobacteria bacterium]
MSTEELPVFPLGTVLFPEGPLPLRIFETRYVDMVSRCMKEGSGFVVAAITSGDDVDTRGFHDTGTIAHIRDFESLPDGLLGIFATGGQRVRILSSRKQGDGLNVGTIERLADEPGCAVASEHEDLRGLLQELLVQLPEYYGSIPRRDDDASWLGYRLSEILPLSLSQKQYFLEMEDPARRLDILKPLLGSLQMIEPTGESGSGASH